MGVAGSGKTVLGSALAAEIGWKFIDADDLHPLSNIEKMRAGQPLDDVDREPWLARIAAELEASSENVVLACSALRQSFRERLPADVRFVQLRAPFEILDARLRNRTNHFMPASLLESQLRTLEEPARTLTLETTEPVPVLVGKIRAAFGI